MKKVLLIALTAALMVLLMSSVALAAGYFTPTAGQNPHGGYQSTSNRCKVCHAAHDAVSGGEVLLRSTVADACTYCHITGAFSIKEPYGTDANHYNTDTGWNHSSVTNATIVNTDAKASLGQAETSKCVNCHAVHGANIANISTLGGTTNVLKTDPGLSGGTTVTDENTFCNNCHSLKHTATTNYNTTSHVQKTAGAYNNSQATYSGTVASAASTNCSNCHLVGDGSDRDAGTPKRNFPHWTSTTADDTAGALEFLDTTYYGSAWNTVTSPNKLDKVCLNCHTNGTTFGVGYTF